MTPHETAAALSEAQKRASRLTWWGYAYLLLTVVLTALDAEHAFVAMMLICAAINFVGSDIVRAIMEQRHD